MISVTIYRRELVALKACQDGMRLCETCLTPNTRIGILHQTASDAARDLISMGAAS